MAGELGDVVAQWITHNEPWVVAFLGHAEGRKAPGIRDWPTALRVVAPPARVARPRGAGAARAARRRGRRSGSRSTSTRSGRHRRPRRIAPRPRIADGYANRWFLDPVLRGQLPRGPREVFGRRFGAPGSVRRGDLG